jgi:hypothetical protein
MEDTFRGQSNGLCGAVCPGSLFLVTGLHTGDVGLRVELHEQEPPLDDGDEEIVEVSFRPASAVVAIVEWGGRRRHPLALRAVDYRVRYCARGMDAGNEADTIVDGPVVDSYRLQLWPAPPGPDRVVRQTGDHAAYWHRSVAEIK